MIDFKTASPDDKKQYEGYLMDGIMYGCERNFVNLYMWGDQRLAVIEDHMVVFSQYNGHYFYPYPMGAGDKKPVLDAIMEDAKSRGIAYCISGLYGDAKETLEELYPGKFSFHYDRDSYDYVYDINDLADLKGRKYHKKRTHYNRFCDRYPDYTVEPLGEENIGKAKQMVDRWYTDRLEESPGNNYHMEQLALDKAFTHYRELEMEGLVLLNGDEVLAVTMGSKLSEDTMDVHFEKARWDVDGAYTAINCEFARYIRDKYPQIKFLNREEDMGLPGLRKSKESYYPHHMVEKCRAVLKEEKNE